MISPSSEHGINRRPLKYVCLAGNFMEYNQWMKTHQIHPHETLFVSRSEILHTSNLPPEVTFHQVGTFYNRSDASEILSVIRSRYPSVTIYTDR